MGLATKVGLLLLRQGLKLSLSHVPSVACRFVLGGTVYSVCKGGLPVTTIAATMPPNTI